MSNEMQLVQWDKMAHEIAEARDIQELSHLSNKLEAIRVIARQSQQSLEVQNRIAEYRLRVERKKGEWLRDNIRKGPNNSTESSYSDLLGSSRAVQEGKATITWDESSKAQKIAELPEEKFEEYIQEAKETNKEITLGAAFTLAKQIIRGEKIEEQVQKLKEKELEAPDGVFDVIVIDPPWHYGDEYNPSNRRGTIPYPSMKQSELRQINLPSADDCILWLWTTNTHIKDAFELLEVWGYAYKSILTWDKVNIGTGMYLRSRTEHCILAIKGSPVWTNKKYSTLLAEKRRQHSQKPDGFYSMVEEICPGRKLDYFARQEREGWEVYGDEVSKDENDKSVV